MVIVGCCGEGIETRRSFGWRFWFPSLSYSSLACSGQGGTYARQNPPIQSTLPVNSLSRSQLAMSISHIEISLSGAGQSSAGQRSMPNGTELYFTKSSLVANIPGNRPRVIASLNGPLRRTETEPALDLPPGQRERSVGLSPDTAPAPLPEIEQAFISTPPQNSTHFSTSSQPVQRRRRKRNADHLDSEPAGPTRFSKRLRKKSEEKKREPPQELEPKKKQKPVKRRKVKQ
ncbi:hypothetical protein FRC03_002110 [Tulasnella sp. 419]|nr:hypothetical protein FRC03_002110 [Tulasnella sp. 419]